MSHEQVIEQDQVQVFSSASTVHDLNPTKQVTKFWVHDIGVGAGLAGLDWPDYFFGDLLKFIIDIFKFSKRASRMAITARPFQKSFLRLCTCF